MSFPGVLTSLVQLFILANAITERLEPPGEMTVDDTVGRDYPTWYLMENGASFVKWNSTADTCKEVGGSKQILPREPELSQSAQNLSVDWKHSWLCEAYQYTVQLDDHSGKTHYTTTIGQTTHTTFTNISSCSTVDVCVSALFGNGFNETVCKLNWRTEKVKPAITGMNYAYGELTVFWSIFGSPCQPQYFQLQVRKGQEIMNTKIHPGYNTVGKLDVRTIHAPFVVLLAAHYADFESTVSEPLEVTMNKAGGNQDATEEALCEPLLHRRVEQNTPVLVPEVDSNLKDPKVKKILKMLRTLTCPILYYQLTISSTHGTTERILLRGQCLTLDPMKVDEYTVHVAVVAAGSRMHRVNEMKFDGKMNWTICSTPELSLTFQPSLTGESSPEASKE